jgi:RNA polymerase sigma-70 factor, ECF subfamily
VINRRPAGHDPIVDRSFALSHPSRDASEDVQPSRHEMDENRSRDLVRDNLDFIWRLLRRLGVPGAEADDATQQVFIVAMGRLHDVTPEAERSFLYGTALRVASTFRRSAARHKKKLGGLRLENHASSAMPDEELEKREALALLDEALAGMADELRHVFVLCDIEELSAREVALLENIPAGTVASRLRRAREAFETRLDELRALQRTR